MFSFPLFLSHSPAPKVIPVMDLNCSGSLKLGEKQTIKRKNLFLVRATGKRRHCDLKTVEEYTFVFLLSFLLLLCLNGGPSHMELHAQQEAKTPREALSFQAEDQEKEPLIPRKHGRSPGA